jgi:protein-histidine pros-kinase
LTGASTGRKTLCLAIKGVIACDRMMVTIVPYPGHPRTFRPMALEGSETAPDAIVVVDWSGHIVIVNELAGRLFGLRQSCSGMPIEDWFPNGLEHHAGTATTIFMTHPSPGEGRNSGGSARTAAVTVEISPQPSEDRDGDARHQHHPDTTARRRLRKVRGFLEAAPDASSSSIATAKMVILNTQAERLFKYARGIS